MGTCTELVLVQFGFSPDFADTFKKANNAEPVTGQYLHRAQYRDYGRTSVSDRLPLSEAKCQSALSREDFGRFISWQRGQPTLDLA
jgi:hypothetical protein